MSNIDSIYDDVLFVDNVFSLEESQTYYCGTELHSLTCSSVVLDFIWVWVHEKDHLLF